MDLFGIGSFQRTVHVISLARFTGNSFTCVRIAKHLLHAARVVHGFHQNARTHPWIKCSHVEHITDAQYVEDFAEWQTVQVAADQLCGRPLRGTGSHGQHRAIPQHLNGRDGRMRQNGEIRVRQVG